MLFTNAGLGNGCGSTLLFFVYYHNGEKIVRMSNDHFWNKFYVYWKFNLCLKGENQNTPRKNLFPMIGFNT